MMTAHVATTHDARRTTTTTHDDDAMADVDSEYSEYDDSGSEFYDSENSPTPVKGKVRARARERRRFSFPSLTMRNDDGGRRVTGDAGGLTGEWYDHACDDA